MRWPTRISTMSHILPPFRNFSAVRLASIVVTVTNFGLNSSLLLEAEVAQEVLV